MPIKKFDYKILVIGERATGKTSYIYKITKNQFSLTYKHTIGVDFLCKLKEISDEKIIAQMWDIPDFNIFFPENEYFLKTALGCIFLSDSTKEKKY